MFNYLIQFNQKQYLLIYTDTIQIFDDIFKLTILMLAT